MAISVGLRLVNSAGLGCFRRTLTEWCRKIYNAYKQLADKESKVIFGGRLGEYKYYDMDQVIAAALERCKLEF